MSDSAHARQSLLRAFCRSWILNMNLFTLDFVSKWDHWLRLIIWTNSKNSLWLKSCACLPSAQRVQAQSSSWDAARTQAVGILVYQFAGATVYQAPDKFPQHCSVGMHSLSPSHLVLDSLHFFKKNNKNLPVKLQLQFLAWIWNF